MLKINKISFLETAGQCLYFSHLYPNPDKVKVYLVVRKKWPSNLNSFKNFLHNYNTTICNIYKVIIIILFNIFKRNEIIIGSHIGYFNKTIILICLFFRLKVTVLDDGTYSLYSRGWMEGIRKYFNKLKWISYFNRDYNSNYIINYCLVSNHKIYNYENTFFLVLPELSSRGISKIREKNFINSIKSYAEKEKAKFIILPHRRGRFELYNEMKLNLIGVNYFCFEDWYLKSNFDFNCKLFATGSSIWQVFEDRRVQNILIDFDGIRSNWIKERFKIQKIIQFDH